MRLNRTTRIGLAFLAAAVLLFGLRALFNSFAPPTAPVDNSANTIAADNSANQARPVSPGGTIYLARENIPERSILTADMFRPSELPSGTPTQGYITDLPTQAVGYITATAIPANNRLRSNALLGHISDIGIAGAIRPGLRGLVVPIANKVTFHDLVKIGSYIDVIGSFDGQEARTIVQNVRVLAVDVFGKDYPQTSVAPRGDYKAPPASVREDSPGSPGGVSSPGGNAASAPGATPTPSPAPAAPPPGRPEAALTLEVTPQQAATLSLAQASGAPLEYLLRPRDLSLYAGGAGTPGLSGANRTTGTNTTGAGSDDLNTVQVTSVTRAELAPYSERLKRQKPASNTASSGSGRSSERVARNVSPPPTFQQSPSNNPGPMSPGVLPPVPTPVPPTYEIPIYGDGKFVRSDTVRNPAASPR